MSHRKSVTMLSRALLIGVTLAGLANAARAADLQNDYPTDARADYVLGCMAANNQTRAALEHCSCSVDVIASILPYDKYEEAETILSMRLGIGAQAREFAATRSLNDTVADLRRAQAEAEIRCFK